MALEVKLEVFEGPLDLLLFLIDKNKVDIYDIPIVLITEQYLDYIKQMEQEDMNVMSEFLVMAATLLEIKCAMLLPKPASEEEEGEAEDPRADLVRQLLEYKMFKYISEELGQRGDFAKRSFFKDKTLPEEVLTYEAPIDYEELLGGATVEMLAEFVRNALRRQEYKVDPIRSKFGEVAKDEIDMELKMLYVEKHLHRLGKLSFRALLERANSKMEIIVTFLVVLELMKLGRVTISQRNLDSDIEVRLAVG